MSRYDAERLYSLLPAVYRRRDAEAGYPLKALVGVLAREAQVVESDVERLYDNSFIETCADWVVPYIAELIGVHPLPVGELRRDEVANTLGYRRRKGTAGVLELLAADVTGWTARAVEGFQHLATTQFLDHPRPGNLHAPDLRDPARLERLHGPFDEAAHTADVRRVAARGGLYNLSNVGLWVWRLEAFPLHLVEPHAVDAEAGRFTFSPLGHDVPLFHHPVTETSAAQIAGEANVPEPIRRRQLAADLRAGTGVYAGAGRSLAVYSLSGGEWKPVATPLVACDLGDWDRPFPDGTIAVDPERGRLVFDEAPPEPLRVSFHQGFSAALGGGQYPRQVEDAETPPSIVVGDPDDPRILANLEGLPLEATLADALAGVQEGWSEGQTRVIEIRDSRTYADALPPVELPANARLLIRAADLERPFVRLPGPFAVDAGEGSALALDGLLIAGDAIEITGELNRLTIRHTTLVPGRALALDGTAQAPAAASLVLGSDTTEAEITSSITGPLWVAAEAEMTLADVILDAGGAAAAYAGPEGGGFGGALRASRVTVVGSVATRTMLLGENSVFLGPVKAERRQEGCVRFSWVAPGSQVPRRHRCLPPDLPADPAAAARLVARLTPRFVTLRYGRPAYAQLDWRGPNEILSGADDGSELGAFSGLGQPHREANLRQRLDEYLPVGLEAGILFAS